MSKVEKKETGGFFRMVVDDSPAWRLLLRLFDAEPDRSDSVAFVSVAFDHLILDMVDAPEFFSDASAFLCNMAGELLQKLEVETRPLAPATSGGIGRRNTRQRAQAAGPQRYAVGTQVQALYPPTSQYFDATVTECNPVDGSYTIDWDDGDKEHREDHQEANLRPRWHTGRGGAAAARGLGNEQSESEEEDSNGEETNAQCGRCVLRFFTGSGNAFCADCWSKMLAEERAAAAATRERAAAAATAAAAPVAAAAAAAGEAPFVEDERFWLRDAGTPEDSGTATNGQTPEPGSSMKCMGACGIKGCKWTSMMSTLQHRKAKLKKHSMTVGKWRISTCNGWVGQHGVGTDAVVGARDPLFLRFLALCAEPVHNADVTLPQGRIHNLSPADCESEFLITTGLQLQTVQSELRPSGWDRLKAHTAKMTAGANWDEHIIATARSAFYLANGEYRGAAEKTDSDKFRWPADALSNDGRSVHISDLPDAATIESPMLLLAGGGLFTKCGVCYVELEISESWCGSQIQIGSNTIECGTKDGMDGYDDNDYFVSVNGGMIDEWEGVWRNEEGKDRLKVGILVDFDMGVCALRLNNANGPCVPLKAEEAREGVMVKLTGDWPDGLTRWSASLSVPEKVPPGLCNYPQRYENLKQQPLQKRQQQQEPTMTHTSGGADSQGREQKKHKIEPA